MVVCAAAEALFDDDDDCCFRYSSILVRNARFGRRSLRERGVRVYR